MKIEQGLISRCPDAIVSELRYSLVEVLVRVKESKLFDCLKKTLVFKSHHIVERQTREF